MVSLFFSGLCFIFSLHVSTASWDPLTATPVLRATVGPFPNTGEDMEIDSLALTDSGYLLMADSSHGGDLMMTSLDDPSNVQSRDMGGGTGVASIALLSDGKIALTTTNVNRLYIFDVSNGILKDYESIQHLNYNHHYHAVADGPDGNVVVAGGRGYVDLVTRQGKLVRNIASQFNDFQPRQMTSYGGDVFVSSSYSSDPGMLRVNVDTGEIKDSYGSFNFSTNKRDKQSPYSSTFGQGDFDADGNFYVAAKSESCRAEGERTNYCVLVITPDGTSRRLVSGIWYEKSAAAVALTPTGFVVAWKIVAGMRYEAAVEIFDMVD